MARAGQIQADQAAQDYTSQSNNANTQAQADIGQYRTNENNINAGKDVAANPWQNPVYLANQNRVTADSLNGATNAAKTDMQRLNNRTGGLNTGATTSAAGSLALEKMRLGNELTAGRTANDWNKNVTYQQEQARTPLGAADAEGRLYGTATTGRDAADNVLQAFGLQSQSFWNNLAMKGINAGAAALGGAAGGAGAMGALSDAGDAANG